MVDSPPANSPIRPRMAGGAEEPQDKELEQHIRDIVRSVAIGIEKPTNQTKDVLTAYSEVLKAASQLESALPKKTVLTFQLTSRELGVLLIYAVGGLVMMWLAGLIPGAGWKAADLVNVLLYWSTVVAVLLGAQALPQIFGKSSSAAASTSKTG